MRALDCRISPVNTPFDVINLSKTLDAPDLLLSAASARRDRARQVLIGSTERPAATTPLYEGKVASRVQSNRELLKCLHTTSAHATM